MNNIELNKLMNIAEFLNVEFDFHAMRELMKNYVNAFEISDKNLIYFYPKNDGLPRCKFEFYKNNRLVIDNSCEYIEISNLDDIILQMVRVFDKALDNKIVLDPYYFMLKLTDDINMNYHGKANLVITEKAIRNLELSETDFTDATIYFINRFLDHFIGWNFGVSVNRCEQLKQELEALNSKVIDMGIREYAGSGLEVYGVEDRAYRGLQHYSLPTKKIKRI